MKIHFAKKSDESLFLPNSTSQQIPRIAHLSCLVNARAGTKLQEIRKILGWGIRCGKTILKIEKDGLQNLPFGLDRII
jgi:hypothetical protein